MVDTSTPSTMRFQGVANRIIRVLLATPLVVRGIGQKLVTVYVVGRKSGRRFTIPVAYTRDGDAMLIGTGFAWGRNPRTGEPVEVRYLGRRRKAEVEVFTDKADVVRLYDVICRDNRNFAGFNKVGIDAAGNPEPADLHKAWAAGARVLRLRVT